MNMTDTLKGSYFAEVFPKGWDIEKIADCVSQPPESVTQPQPGTPRSSRSPAKTSKNSVRIWATRSPCRSARQRRRAAS